MGPHLVHLQRTGAVLPCLGEPVRSLATGPALVEKVRRGESRWRPLSARCPGPRAQLDERASLVLLWREVCICSDCVSIILNLSHDRCPSPKHCDQPTDPPSHTRPRPRPTSPRLGSSTWHQERLGEHELIPGTYSFQASWSTQSIFPPAASNAILGFPQLWLWKRGW